MVKKIILRILWGLMAIIVIGSLICYLVYQPEKPMLALLIAGCGGVLVLNLGVAMYLVNKNLRK